eukprot:scaffold224040_cov31-Tisochrysis_lutea.AAC.5
MPQPLIRSIQARARSGEPAFACAAISELNETTSGATPRVPALGIPSAAPPRAPPLLVQPRPLDVRPESVPEHRLLQLQLFLSAFCLRAKLCAAQATHHLAHDLHHLVRLTSSTVRDHRLVELGKCRRRTCRVRVALHQQLRYLWLHDPAQPARCLAPSASCRERRDYEGVALERRLLSRAAHAMKP